MKKYHTFTHMKRILLLSFMLLTSILGTKAAADDADGATIVKIAVSVKGKATYPTNKRCGYITANYGSGASTLEVLASQNGKTLEMKLPSGSAVKFRGEAYHGWDFDGVAVTDDGIAKASFTANERTEYQCLAYTDLGTQYYRIPAIARNHRDELVAVYDVRECRNDVGFGEVDQAMRYSKDNGKTWSEETIIADGDASLGGNSFGLAYGDPAIGLDRESGTGVLITVSGQTIYAYATATQRPLIAMQKTTDGGHSWSTPVDITPQFWGSSGSMFQDGEHDGDGKFFAYAGFFGSGKILQSRIVKKGKYYRLYAALLVRGTGLRGAYVVYSDDMGETWNLLGGDATIQACKGSDEPKVEELPNGSIVLSGRMQGGRCFNIWTYDKNSTTSGSWDIAVDSALQPNGIKAIGNSTNGELLIVWANDAKTGVSTPIALQSVPFGKGRFNVGLYYKVLDADKKYTPAEFASGWIKSSQVSTTSSAYSTMCLQADNRIAFFYEEGPSIYEMIYVPLDIERLTNHAYTTKKAGQRKLILPTR